MGIFNFRRKTAKDVNIVPTEEEFTDNSDPIEGSDSSTKDKTSKHTRLQELYEYAQTDFERKGYSDSLVNHDNSYKEDNIKLLIYDLKIKAEETIQFYEHFLRDIDTHIKIREDAGLIDTVLELNAKKEKTEADLQKAKEVLQDCIDNKGWAERIALSYKRGFMKGLVSSSENEIINKEL